MRPHRAIFFFLLVVSLALIGVKVGATPKRQDTSSSLEVEWDPSVLLLKGFSAVALYSPAALPALRFGADVFTFALPSFQLEDRWEARAFGGTAILRYHPWGGPDGFWVAAMLRVGQWHFTHQPQGKSAPFFDVAFAPRLGYNWAPFDGRFYLSAQMGVAIPLFTTGIAEVGGETHPKLAPFPTPALHVGYGF